MTRGTGWDAASEPVPLAAPWESFWVSIYLDPPLGDYLDMQAAFDAANADPSAANINALVATIEPLVADHNMVGRDGSPLAFDTRSMGVRLIVSITEAIKQVQKGGASADPLPPSATSRKRATSRRPASSASRSRRTTPSGVSR